MDSSTITYRSAGGAVSYTDSRDHFENGFLRLMKMSEETFKRWLDLSEKAPGDSLLDRLRNGFTSLKMQPIGESEFGEQSGTGVVLGPNGIQGKVFQKFIRENPKYGVGQSLSGNLGWLLKRGEQGTYEVENEPPIYEKEYFEGDRNKAGGYGKYLEQADWRLEKARRQVREIQTITGLKSGNVLDVGSGYGYFRKALEEVQLENDGIEISEHARNVAKDVFGLDTCSNFEEILSKTPVPTYDLLTLWDVIEHVSDPVAFIEEAGRLVKQSGYIAVKTPNLRCPEANIFGPDYHSFKREHLYYFTAESLNEVFDTAGFHLAKGMSISHLLGGFFGKEITDGWERKMEGADLYCVYRKS